MRPGSAFMTKKDAQILSWDKIPYVFAASNRLIKHRNNVFYANFQYLQTCSKGP